jgi:hypothetical protein
MIKEILDEIQAVIEDFYEDEATFYEESFFPEEENVSIERLEEHALNQPKPYRYLFSTLAQLKKFVDTYKDRRMVIVVSGGVVQNVMADQSMSDVEVHLLDYDNLKAGQTSPTVEQWVEVNPEQVEMVIAGEHPDQKEYLEHNQEEVVTSEEDLDAFGRPITL